MGESQEIPIPGSRRSHGIGNGNPQYSRLENPKNRGAWRGYSSWGHKESDMAQHVCTTHRWPRAQFFFFFFPGSVLNLFTPILVPSLSSSCLIALNTAYVLSDSLSPVSKPSLSQTLMCKLNLLLGEFL